MKRAKEAFQAGDMVDIRLKDGTRHTLLYILTKEYTPVSESHFVMADPDHEHFGQKVMYTDDYKDVSEMSKIGHLDHDEWHRLAKVREVLRKRISEMREKTEQPEWLREFL